MLSSPRSKLSQRHRALSLFDQKIACFKILKSSSEKCGAIVFHSVPDGGARGDPDSQFVELRLNANQHIRFANIVAESDVSLLRITNQQLTSIQCLDRGLVIQLKFPDGFDFVGEKLDSDR